MQKAINQLIKETESKIINILVRAYNSDRINEQNFVKYEMNEIKNLLFMRGELEEKLYNLLEGYNEEDMEEIG